MFLFNPESVKTQIQPGLYSLKKLRVDMQISNAVEVTGNDMLKTPQDIREAIELGLHMNLDNDLEVVFITPKKSCNFGTLETASALE